MTLLLTEICSLGGVFAADRNISRTDRNGKIVSVQEAPKIFQIEYLTGAVGYFGVAQVNGEPMERWLPKFISHNSEVNTLRDWIRALHKTLRRQLTPQERSKPLGFHVFGYGRDASPEFWKLMNADPDRMTGEYRIRRRWNLREDLMKRDAPRFARKHSLAGVQQALQQGIFFYRNGWLLPYLVFGDSLHKALLNLHDSGDFRPIGSLEEFAERTKFVLKVLVDIYNAFGHGPQPIGGEPDIILVSPSGVRYL